MLSSDSIQVIKFLLHNSKISKIKITNTICMEWLKTLYYQIKSIKTQSLKYVRTEQCSRLNQNQYISDQFTAKPIKQEIKTITNCDIYSIMGTEVVIATKNTKLNMKHVGDIITIMKTLSGVYNAPYLINIWNTAHPKQLPCKCGRLEPVNINSGSTLPGEYINVWRHEEIYKVLIHELVHTLDLDFRDMTVIQPYIRANYNISRDSPVLIWESYTEFIAIIIHSMYFSKSFDSFITILSIELEFSLFQTAKVLHNFGCNNLNDLQQNKSCEISYDTDVLSYFYIKTALLFSLNESILFCKEFNLNTLKFNKERATEYLELIDKTTKNCDFIKKINSYILFLQSNSNKDNVVFKTLKMSIIN